MENDRNVRNDIYFSCVGIQKFFNKFAKSWKETIMTIFIKVKPKKSDGQMKIEKLNVWHNNKYYRISCQSKNGIGYVIKNLKNRIFFLTYFLFWTWINEYRDDLLITFKLIFLGIIILKLGQLFHVKMFIKILKKIYSYTCTDF